MIPENETAPEDQTPETPEPEAQAEDAGNAEISGLEVLEEKIDKAISRLDAISTAMGGKY